MSLKPIILAIAGASLALGVCLLVTASMTANSVRMDSQSVFCKTVGDLGVCDFVKYWFAAAALGIIASLAQIVAFGAAWTAKTRIWCGFHILIFVLTLASFAIAMDQKVFADGGGYQDEVRAFAVFSLIDMIFAPIGAIAVHFMTK